MMDGAPMPEISASSRAELARKVLHLSSAAFPLLYLGTSRELMLWVSLPFVLLQLVIDVGRRYSSTLQRIVERCGGGMMRPRERHALTGATYVLLAIWLSILIFPKPVAIAVLLMLSISDALASLVGARLGGVRFLGKSLAGSAVFFVSAWAIAALIFPHRPGLALFAAALGTLVEAVHLRIGRLEIDDNLTVPFITGAAICLLLTCW